MTFLTAPYYDSTGLIFGLDGGDSCQRMAMQMLWHRLYFGPDPAKFMFVHLKLLNKNGNLVRNPNSKWNDPKDMPEDQLGAWFVAAAAHGSKVAKSIWDDVTSNGYRWPNGNLIHPNFLSSVARHFEWKHLWFYDMVLFAAVLLRNLLKTWDRFDVGDDLNISLQVIFGAAIRETFFIRLCRRWFNPRPAFARYFRSRMLIDSMIRDSNAPPIHESYDEILREVFGR